MTFTCRLMHEEEFTNEFKLYVMETFFQYEPMNQYLKTKIPDELDMSWLEHVLHRAKSDKISLALYDSKNTRSLPVAYALNHHDKRDDDDSDVLYSILNPQYVHKHEHISGILTKLHEDVDLFEQFHCSNLFHVYFLGVDPIHRQNRLASQLIDSCVQFATDKHFDLIYADVTGDYSLNAFLKQKFQTIKTIDYASYENLYRAKTFENILHKGCSIVVRDLRNE